MTGLELDDYLCKSYMDKTVDTFEQAIKFKFPKIKGLDVSYCKSSKINISFEPDEYHTEKRINNFLKDLRNDNIQRTIKISR